MTPWHCTTDGVIWPGCGRCGPCRQAAPAVFAQARELQAHLRADLTALQNENYRLRAAVDRVRATCATFVVGWDQQLNATPEYVAYGKAFIEAARRIDAALAAVPTEPAEEQTDA